MPHTFVDYTARETPLVDGSLCDLQLPDGRSGSAPVGCIDVEREAQNKTVDLS